MFTESIMWILFFLLSVESYSTKLYIIVNLNQDLGSFSFNWSTLDNSEFTLT